MNKDEIIEIISEILNRSSHKVSAHNDLMNELDLDDSSEVFNDIEEAIATIIIDHKNQ